MTAYSRSPSGAVLSTFGGHVRARREHGGQPSYSFDFTGVRFGGLDSYDELSSLYLLQLLHEVGFCVLVLKLVKERRRNLSKPQVYFIALSG